MRQTGRTSRIINFVVDQLMSTGYVVATDHCEYEGVHSLDNLNEFSSRVIARIHKETKSKVLVRVNIFNRPGTKINLISFELVNNPKT